jgi:hypothetical protein
MRFMPAMLDGGDASFRILHGWPAGPFETQWRACLADSDDATHYTAPEYFCEPSLRGKKPFAVLSMIGERIAGVLTGIHDGDHLQSGLSVRPQIAFCRDADRSIAMRSLIAGLLREAETAKLVDLFVWHDMAAAVGPRFHERRYEGVVTLNLSRGPDALFRRLSANKRTNIKKAIKYGICVATANSRDDVSSYYAVYVDWARRKALPVVPQDEFQETFSLRGNRRLFLARHDGQVIAGVVVRFYPGGVMEYAANSSLESALYLRPNDLLHWRAIEWACAEGLEKYSLGGAHLFLRKFGGEVVPTTRHRLDQSLLRRYVAGDWIAERAEELRPLLPDQVVALGRSLRTRLERLRAYHGRGSG